jgi:hypothetical protein
MKMKRRKFLTIAGIGGLIAGLATFGIAFQGAIEKVIFSELGFLKLDNEGVRRFVADYTRSMTSKNKMMLKGYSFMGIGAAKSQKINSLINAYLLSTDFFMNKMDEGRTIKYIGLYDPYTRPCAHPFSSAFYSADVAHNDVKNSMSQ